MKRLIAGISIACFLSLISFTMAHALPSLQVYIPGSTAGNVGEDVETWVSDGTIPAGEEAFKFKVVVSLGNDKNPTYQSVSYLTLVLTVPQSQANTGIISISDLTPQVGPPFDTREEFLPEGVTFDNHYPFGKENEFNYIVFGFGLTVPQQTGLYNYNAQTGEITLDPNEVGWEQDFIIQNVDGFDSVHFDVYALFSYGTLNEKNPDWKINPGSHDSTTVVPEPATMFLLGSGLIGVGVFLRRKFKR